MSLSAPSHHYRHSSQACFSCVADPRLLLSPVLTSHPFLSHIPSLTDPFRPVSLSITDRLCPPPPSLTDPCLPVLPSLIGVERSLVLPGSQTAFDLDDVRAGLSYTVRVSARVGGREGAALRRGKGSAGGCQRGVIRVIAPITGGSGQNRQATHPCAGRPQVKRVPSGWGGPGCADGQARWGSRTRQVF